MTSTRCGSLLNTIGTILAGFAVTAMFALGAIEYDIVKHDSTMQVLAGDYLPYETKGAVFYITYEKWRIINVIKNSYPWMFVSSAVVFLIARSINTRRD